MTKFISELAAGLVPYVPGEQPKDRKYIKLNTNENPYPPSDRVIAAIREEASSLRLYPDPQADAVRDAAAAYYNDALSLRGDDALSRDNVFAGNGSDEVLSLLCPAFLTGKRAAFADITYSFYPSFLSLFGVPYETIPLAEDYSIRVEDYLSLEDGIGGIFLCNPNAPTGRGLPLSEIKRILEGNRARLVIVDEAYVDFGGESAAGLVNRYDNLLVIQTLSKSRQLAGMRVGLALGCPELIRVMHTVKDTFNSYPVDRLAIAAAVAAFGDRAYFEDTRARIMETRANTTAELEKLRFDVLPSCANFIFAKPSGIAAKDLFLQLRERGVLVRYFDKPRIDDRLRITIGTPEEMDALLRAVKEILAR